MTSYLCISDRFCAQPETFSSLDEFQAMCMSVFGEPADLTPNGADYVDENGSTVIVVVEDV